MDTKELLKKVRKIEIKTRRLSDHVFGGEYHSTFKGRGMIFSEVRQYQFGDDVRNIDWNVTARYNEPFVKVFEEERELTVMLLVDVSESLGFGSKSAKSDQIYDPMEGDFTSVKTSSQGSLTLGVNGIAGVDFYFADNIYLGAELGFGIAYTMEMKETQEFLTGDGDEVDSVEVPGGSSFNVGPNVVGAIRLGFLF